MDLINRTTDDLVKDQDLFKAVADEVFRWEQHDKEHAQTRSNFQIEKFIAMDNFTISSAFQSLLRNRRALAEGLFQKITEMKETQREFEYKWNDKPKDGPIEWFTREGGKKLCWYDIDSLNMENYMRLCELEIRDRAQQMQFFDQLLDRLIELNGAPITKQQFDCEDQVYWERRFANQIHDEILARHTGVSPGNIHSVRNATAPTICQDDKNRIKNDFPTMLELFNGAEGIDRFMAVLQASITDGVQHVTQGKKPLINIEP